MLRRFTCVAVLPLLLSLAGCVTPDAPPISSGSVHVGDAQVDYWAGPNGPILVLVWKTPPGNFGNSSGMSSSAAKTEISGELRVGDGKRIAWAATTTDLTTGKVAIGPANYELSQGRLFLIDTTGDEPQITQLNRDLSKVEPGEQGLSAFVAADPELASFVVDQTREP